jgi:hypothetical protein
MANRIVRSQGGSAGATASAVVVSAIVAAIAALGLLATASVAAAQQTLNGANVAGPSSGGPLIQRNTPPAGIDMRALLNDPLIRDFRGLSENSWDFTDPYGVPGFGPMPTPSQGGIDK